MEIKELKKFADMASERIHKNHLAGYDLEKRILHATVKVNEEAGELCDAVLSALGSQRANKLAAYDKDGLALEVADVIFSHYGACIARGD